MICRKKYERGHLVGTHEPPIFLRPSDLSERIGRALEEGTGFKTQARIAGMELRAVTVPDVAQEIGCDVGEPEELLIAVIDVLARPEKLLVHLCGCQNPIGGHSRVPRRAPR